MLTLNDINFKYSQSKEILSETNLEVNDGEFIFVIGESGIGKTTLMKLMYFEIFPNSGKVKFENFDSDTIDKSEIPLARRKIGIVFQDFKLFNDRNVYDNIAVPLFIAKEKKENVRKKVYEIASKVGLIDKIKEMPYDLSGGEQQRVAIARAIVTEPKLIVADEPTGNLDPFIGYEIVKLLDDINIKGTTVIVATHNFEIVRKFRDKRIIQIKNKKLFDVRLKN